MERWQVSDGASGNCLDLKSQEQEVQVMTLRFDDWKNNIMIF